MIILHIRCRKSSIVLWIPFTLHLHCSCFRSLPRIRQFHPDFVPLFKGRDVIDGLCRMTTTRVIILTTLLMAAVVAVVATTTSGATDMTRRLSGGHCGRCIFRWRGGRSCSSCCCSSTGSTGRSRKICRCGVSGIIYCIFSTVFRDTVQTGFIGIIETIVFVKGR